jgi:hypothetical protein
MNAVLKSSCCHASAALTLLNRLPMSVVTLQPSHAQECTGYSEAQLRPIVQRMTWVWQQLRQSSMKALFKYYSESKRFNVVALIDEHISPAPASTKKKMRSR